MSAKSSIYLFNLPKFFPYATQPLFIHDSTIKPKNARHLHTCTD